MLGLPYSFVDGIAELDSVPARQDRYAATTSAMRKRTSSTRAKRSLLDQREADEEEVRERLSLACELEGLPRNVSMHAGGGLIAPGRLADFCPVYVPSPARGPGVRSSTRTTWKRSASSSSVFSG